MKFITKNLLWYGYFLVIFLSFFSYKNFNLYSKIDIVVSVGFIAVLSLYIFNKRYISQSYAKVIFWLQLVWTPIYALQELTLELRNVQPGLLVVLVFYFVVAAALFYPGLFALYAYAYRGKTLLHDDVVASAFIFQFFKKFNGKLAEDNSLHSKIGGWLLLVGLGLIIFSVRTFYSFFTTVSTIFNAPVDIYQAIPTLKSVLIVEAVGQSFFVAWSLYVLVLFFTKRKIFPNQYIAMYLATILFNYLDITLVSHFGFPNNELRSLFLSGINALWIAIIQTLVNLALWGTYLKISKRSKATFVK